MTGWHLKTIVLQDAAGGVDAKLFVLEVEVRQLKTWAMEPRVLGLL